MVSSPRITPGTPIIQDMAKEDGWFPLHTSPPSLRT